MYKRKLEISEDRHRIFIKYSWFRSIAFVLAFIGIICLVFYVFAIYSIFELSLMTFMVLGGPYILAFSLIIIYITLLLFLNSTEIEMDSEYIHINHGPIPSTRSNKKLNIKEVAQLYVKEEQFSKNGYMYSLECKLKNKRGITIVPNGLLVKEQSLLLEELIEKFLGIQDVSVEEEVIIPSKAPENTDQISKRNILLPKSHPLRSDVGDSIGINGLRYRIKNEIQYDWDSGHSHKQFYFSGEGASQRFLYMGHVNGALSSFLEEELVAHQVADWAFDVRNPKKVIRIDDENYFLMKRMEGKGYSYNNAQGFHSYQYVYTPMNGQNILRVVLNKSTVSFFRGTDCKVETLGSEDVLTLNEPVIQKVNQDRDYV